MTMTDPDLIALWAFESRPVSDASVGTAYTLFADHIGTAPRPPSARASSWRSGRWAPGTLQMARRSLRSLYRWLHDQGLVDETSPSPSPPSSARKCPSESPTTRSETPS